MTTGLQDKNRKTMAVTLGVVAGMVVLSFASVPLYKKLCQVTGWGGTTQMVEANPNAGKAYGRDITVRFSASVNRDMPWTFRPDLNAVHLKVGQDGIISFRAKNNAAVPVAGTAVYNVTPLKAGKYFFKTQCFCFGEQVLNSGEEVNMPVTFFVDPAIMDDPEMKDVGTITLSYTFFRHNSEALDKAVEKFYNEHSDASIN
jgi:cytochrome c oxidase assembly protein subunit 11